MKERIKVSQNFYLDEFIDPYTYLSNSCYGLTQIDLRIFAIAQFVRSKHGSPLVINTWWKTFKKYEGIKSVDEIVSIIINDGMIRKASGLRPSQSNVGAKGGAHYTGQAIDIRGNANSLQKIVRDNAKEMYNLGVRRLEDIVVAKTWLHLDTNDRNCKPNSIRVIDATKSTETIYF